jgi:hypothetical protein
MHHDEYVLCGVVELPRCNAEPAQRAPDGAEILCVNDLESRLLPRYFAD